MTTNTNSTVEIVLIKSWAKGKGDIAKKIKNKEKLAVQVISIGRTRNQTLVIGLDPSHIYNTNSALSAWGKTVYIKPPMSLGTHILDRCMSGLAQVEKPLDQENQHRFTHTHTHTQIFSMVYSSVSASWHQTKQEVQGVLFLHLQHQVLSQNQTNAFQWTSWLKGYMLFAHSVLPWHWTLALVIFYSYE